MTESKAITVRTANFGEIGIPPESVLHFSEGIPGFPRIHNFAILEFENIKPFQYLQSLDDPPVALLVVNPFLLCPAYRIDLGDADIEDLHTKNTEDVAVFSVVTIPADPAEATLNLMAPILINQKGRCGRQVILLDSPFATRHPLFVPAECQGSENV
jgi:flagellar assembly factor FliW